MKIKRLQLFTVKPRWLFLKIETDNGLIGWGEPIVEGKAATVKTAVEELSCSLIGRNPLHIEDIWQVLYRGFFYRGGAEMMSAISGIDQALWDIKGKYYNAPVYDLLGGRCREKIIGKYRSFARNCETYQYPHCYRRENVLAVGF